jgi:hypothetical protein
MSEQPEQHEGHPVVAVGANAGPGIRSAQQQPGEGDSGSGGDDDENGGPLAEMVEEPAKVMRIGTMIKQLLEEVRAAPLDDKSRARMREIHETSIKELSEGLAPDLRDELGRIALPFQDDVPSDAELRVAHAQLVGWLEGLFHGIQTALFAQQMAARQQLQGMRRALPGGMPPGMAPGMQPGGEGGPEGHPGGPYL